MTIKQIQVSHFRNLMQISSELSPRFNVFFGDNGSGKTSLLEAIYVLSHAKSFRTHLMPQLVQKNQEKLTIHAKLLDEQQNLTSIGFERCLQGHSRIHINGENCFRTADIAQMLPMLIINPDSYHLVEAGPQYRRKFLDWGLFHVEQSFFSVWRTLQRIIKQRNAALKKRMPLRQIKVWDQELISSAESIDQLRRQYFKDLGPILIVLLAELPFFDDFSSQYCRGWPDNDSYADVLEQALEHDLAMGYTRYGPQRADMKLFMAGAPAGAVLSRGQQKILVNALFLAQGILLAKKTGKKCIFLIDDLPSELDEQHRAFLIDKLSELNAQVFVTGVARHDLQPHFQHVPHNMFHVEHGKIHIVSS